MHTVYLIVEVLSNINSRHALDNSKERTQIPRHKFDNRPGGRDPGATLPTEE